MHIVSIALVGGLITALGAVPARAAVLDSDATVTVDLFSPSAAVVSVSNVGAVTSDLGAPTSITIGATFDATAASGATPVDVPGPELIVTASAGTSFLEGEIAGLAFDAADPASATRIDFTFTPTAGSNVADFSPQVLAGLSNVRLTEPVPGFLTGTGDLSVSQVPIPGALPLMLSAVGALAIGRFIRGAPPSRNEASG